VLKFSLALYSFSKLLGRGKSDYQLDLMEFDPAKRLGLGPLGKAYNGFLLFTVLYQLYVFLHRLQIIAQWEGVRSGQEVVLGLFDPKIWLNPKFYGFIGLGDWGVLLSLLMMFGLVVTVCYLPLLKLHRRVREIKEQKYDKYAALHEVAMKRGDEEDADDYYRRMMALEGANVWPNGNLTAYWSLMLMGVLLIASWLPPLLLPLLAVGVVLALIQTIRVKVNQIARPPASA
jgi:hypothetical protein